ncbi:MAG: hypothetical protein IJ906_00320 [Oscillospiraceae bacterium]|nr:hypothetical protein [Oscillospiraceae bacterium]
MIELHGWMKLSEIYEDEDTCSPDTLSDIREQVHQILNTHGLQITSRNGEAFLETLFCSNHRTEEIGSILDAYTETAKAATGSYGMLWIRDDENPEHFNAFQVYCFKHGKRYLQEDTMLSPCIPEIEGSAF